MASQLHLDLQLVQQVQTKIHLHLHHLNLLYQIWESQAVMPLEMAFLHRRKTSILLVSVPELPLTTQLQINLRCSTDTILPLSHL